MTADSPLHGVRVAVDVGSVRVGIARTDPQATMAFPVDTLGREADTAQTIAERAREWQAIVIYVGLPVGLSGVSGHAADSATAFAKELASTAHCPVRTVDERFSTVDAQRRLQASGRSVKDSRGIIDQEAAVIILEQALAMEAAAGTLAGDGVTVVTLASDEPEGSGA